jgi:YHS domain-containing protein
MKTIRIIFSLALVLLVTALRAQVAPIDEKGLAIGGYDVVSYFAGKPTKGDSKISAKNGNATYQFATIANREAFKKNPTKYLPEFDGYCAWGVGAKSTKFPINPETFEIIDGKLYLFFNGPFNGSNFNTLDAWNEDQDNLLKAANANWPAVKGVN